MGTSGKVIVEREKTDQGGDEGQKGIVILGTRRTEAQKPFGALRRKAQGALEARTFLFEAHPT